MSTAHHGNSADVGCLSSPSQVGASPTWAPKNKRGGRNEKGKNYKQQHSSPTSETSSIQHASSSPDHFHANNGGDRNISPVVGSSPCVVTGADSNNGTSPGNASFINTKNSNASGGKVSKNNTPSPSALTLTNLPKPLSSPSKHPRSRNGLRINHIDINSDEDIIVMSAAATNQSQISNRINNKSVSVPMADGTFRREIPLDEVENDENGEGALRGPRPNIHHEDLPPRSALGGIVTHSPTSKKAQPPKTSEGSKGKIKEASKKDKAQAPKNRTVAGVKAMITTPSHTFWFWSLQPHSYKGLPPKPYVPLPAARASSREPNAAAMVMRRNNNNDDDADHNDGAPAAVANHTTDRAKNCSTTSSEVSPQSPVPHVSAATPDSNEKEAPNLTTEKVAGGIICSPTVLAVKTSKPVHDAMQHIFDQRKEERFWDAEDKKAFFRSHGSGSIGDSVGKKDTRKGSAISSSSDPKRSASFLSRSNANGASGRNASSPYASPHADQHQPTSPFDHPPRDDIGDSDDEEDEPHNRKDDKVNAFEDPSTVASALQRGHDEHSKKKLLHDAHSSSSASSSVFSRMYWATRKAFSAIDTKMAQMSHRVDDKILRRKLKQRDAKNRKRWEDHFFWLMTDEQQAKKKLENSSSSNSKTNVISKNNDGAEGSTKRSPSRDGKRSNSASKKDGAGRGGSGSRSPNEQRGEEGGEHFIASYECWVVHQGGRTRAHAMLSTNYLSLSCENGYLLDAIPLKKIVSYQRALVYDDHNNRWCRFAHQHEKKGHCLCSPQFAPLAFNNGAYRHGKSNTIGAYYDLNASGNDATDNTNLNNSTLSGPQHLDKALPSSIRSGASGGNNHASSSAGVAGNNHNYTSTSSGISGVHASNADISASSSNPYVPAAPTAIQIFTARGQVYQLWGFFSNTIPIKVRYVADGASAVAVGNDEAHHHAAGAASSVNAPDNTDSAHSVLHHNHNSRVALVDENAQVIGAAAANENSHSSSLLLGGGSSVQGSNTTTTSVGYGNGNNTDEGGSVWWYDVDSIKKRLNVNKRNKNLNANCNDGRSSADGGCVGANGSGAASLRKQENANKKKSKKATIASALASIATQRNQRGHLINFESLLSKAWHSACERPNSGCGGVPHRNVEYVDEEGYVFVNVGAENKKANPHADDVRESTKKDAAGEGGHSATSTPMVPAYGSTPRRTAPRQRLNPPKSPQQKNHNDTHAPNSNVKEADQPVDNKVRAQQAAREMAMKGGRNGAAAVKKPL